MTKLLVLILLALLLGLALERLLSGLKAGLGPEDGSGRRRRPGSGRSRGGARGGAPSPPGSSDVTLAPCEGCGVHVPRSRLERRGGRSLCGRCRSGS